MQLVNSLTKLDSRGIGAINNNINFYGNVQLNTAPQCDHITNQRSLSSKLKDLKTGIGSGTANLNQQVKKN